MAESTSQEIIAQALGGSNEAIRFLVVQNQAFAYSVAYRFLGNSEDAEDIVQEAFIRLWKNLHKYNPEVKLTTWLYRIIANLCLDFLKSAYGRQRKNTVDVHPAVHHSIGSDELIQSNELNRWIQEAASGLTPKQKAVFILRDLEDLSVEEVCGILSMSAGNVKSNLYYARKQMSEKLKKYYQTSDKIRTI